MTEEINIQNNLIDTPIFFVKSSARPMKNAGKEQIKNMASIFCNEPKFNATEKNILIAIDIPPMRGTLI